MCGTGPLLLAGIFFSNTTMQSFHSVFNFLFIYLLFLKYNCFTILRWFLLYDEVNVICIHVSPLSWASLLPPSNPSWLCILETVDLVLCTLVSLETQQIVNGKKQLCIWDLKPFHILLYIHTPADSSTVFSSLPTEPFSWAYGV